MSGRIGYPIAGGDLEIEFGVNRWVLVETPDGQSEQRQLAHEQELAAFLRELGITEADARAAAAQAWSERPEEAAFTAPRSGESLKRSTGQSSWKLGGALILFIAVFAVVLLVIITR